MAYLDRTQKRFVSGELLTAADANKHAELVYHDIQTSAQSIAAGADVLVFAFSKVMYSGSYYMVDADLADVYSAAGSYIQTRLWIGGSIVLTKSIQTDGVAASGGRLTWPTTVASDQSVPFVVQVQIVGAQTGTVAALSQIWIWDAGPVS